MNIEQNIYIWHEPIPKWGFHEWLPMVDQDRCLVCHASGRDYRREKIPIKKTYTNNPEAPGIINPNPEESL